MFAPGKGFLEIGAGGGDGESFIRLNALRFDAVRHFLPSKERLYIQQSVGDAHSPCIILWCVSINNERGEGDGGGTVVTEWRFLRRKMVFDERGASMMRQGSSSTRGRTHAFVPDFFFSCVHILQISGTRGMKYLRTRGNPVPSTGCWIGRAGLTC